VEKAHLKRKREKEFRRKMERRGANCGDLPGGEKGGLHLIVVEETGKDSRHGCRRKRSCDLQRRAREGDCRRNAFLFQREMTKKGGGFPRLFCEPLLARRRGVGAPRSLKKETAVFREGGGKSQRLRLS